MRKKLPSRKSIVRKLDDRWSRIIRARTKKDTGGRCPFCGVNPIECAFHFVTRSKQCVRWEPDNLVGSCNACNFQNEYNPDPFRLWYIRNRGVDTYTALVLRSNKPANFGRGELIEMLAEAEAILEKESGKTLE